MAEEGKGVNDGNCLVTYFSLPTLVLLLMLLFQLMWPIGGRWPLTLVLGHFHRYMHIIFVYIASSSGFNGKWRKF